MSTSAATKTRSAIQVGLDREFMTGTRGPTTDLFYIDYPQMSLMQRRTLKYLVMQVLNQIPVEGRNKPSYMLIDGTLLPDTELYQEFKLWHYHSGDWIPGNKQAHYNSYHNGHTTVIDLQSNPLGKTSSACLHYVWESPTSVRIVAYSAMHIPFPKESDPKNTILLQLIDALP